MYKIGPLQKKIILALAGGAAMGMAHSSRQYYRAFRALRKDWNRINQQNFKRSIRRLSDCKLLEEKILADGTFKLALTPEGKQKAEVLNIFGDSIKFKKPARWDGKWRIVLFDIPEKDRAFRDILRAHLYDLDFHKLQYSVFVSPWPFEKQILELVLLYEAEPFVRVITATKIDNEIKLKKHFFKHQS